MNKNNYLQQHINLDQLFSIKEDDVVRKLPKVFGDNRTIFTAYGRNALYLGLKQISELTSKRDILVPAYSCGDEIQAIISAGYKVKPYEIDNNLTTNMIALENLVDVNTAGILFTHFFGFPFKEIKRLIDIRKRFGIYLIEDCAHSFGGKHGNKYLGSFGDISIFSLRKFFPIPHGGALIINNSKIKSPVPKIIPNAAIEKDLAIYFSYRSGIFQSGVDIPSQIRDKKDNRHSARLLEYGGYELGISKLALYFIYKSAPIDIQSRRNIFQSYIDMLRNKEGVRLLFSELGEGVNPLFFPLIVNNSEKIASVLRNSNEIFTQPFWSYEHNFIDWNNFPEALMLKKNILVLPVHQKLSFELINRLLKVV